MIIGKIFVPEKLPDVRRLEDRFKDAQIDCTILAAFIKKGKMYVDIEIDTKKL